MRPFIAMITVPLLVAATVVSGNTTPVPAPQEGSVSKGNNQFAADLYAQLRNEGGNLFFSPASISTAFAMAYAGSRGQTAQQIARVLHFEEPPDKLNADFARLLAGWNSGAKEQGYQLAVANAFWGQQGYPFSPAFNHLLQTSYGAGMHEVNFRDSEAARAAINRWVEQQTQDKIKDLIPPRGVGPATVLVLTNAVYFKAAWDHQFREAATRPEPFRLQGGKTADVPMMHQLAEFRYLKGDAFAALEMTYAQEMFSMIVFLPDPTDGLEAFEKSFTADHLEAWARQLGGASRTDVLVSLPKFKMTEEISLPTVLSRMGMPLAFSGQADFSAMNDGKEPLFITAAYHKAYVDVNEKGTEAAAATGIAVGRAALPRQIPTFKADHPFVFVIRDNHSGSVLFMGRVVNPNGK